MVSGYFMVCLLKWVLLLLLLLVRCELFAFNTESFICWCWCCAIVTAACLFIHFHLNRTTQSTRVELELSQLDSHSLSQSHYFSHLAFISMLPAPLPPNASDKAAAAEATNITAYKITVSAFVSAMLTIFFFARSSHSSFIWTSSSLIAFYENGWSRYRELIQCFHFKSQPLI